MVNYWQHLSISIHPHQHIVKYDLFVVCVPDLTHPIHQPHFCPFSCFYPPIKPRKHFIFHQLKMATISNLANLAPATAVGSRSSSSSSSVLPRSFLNFRGFNSKLSSSQLSLRFNNHQSRPSLL